MFPELITIGGFTIYTYGVILAAAYLIAIVLSVRLAKKDGLDSRIMVDLAILVLITAIIGAKLFYVLGHLPEMIETPSRLLDTLRAGGVFQGGLIVAAAAGIWFLVRKKQPVWRYTDAIAPGIALGQAIGRIGCFCAGCCYGKPAGDLPWAVTFHEHSISAPVGVPLHPVQIYESLLMFAMFILLIVLWKRRSFAGQIFWTYVIAYSVVRGGIVEWFRGDHPAVFLGLTGQQIIAVFTLIFGMFFYILLRGRRESAPRHGAAGKQR